MEMNNEKKKPQKYGLSDGGLIKPPSYARVVQTMTNEEIEWELEHKKGDAEFLEFVKKEKAFRKKKGCSDDR